MGFNHDTTHGLITACITQFSEINFKVYIKLSGTDKTAVKAKVVSKITQFRSGYSHALVWHGILCVSDHQFNISIKASSPLKTRTLSIQQPSFFMYIVGLLYNNKGRSIKSFSIMPSPHISQ